MIGIDAVDIERLRDTMLRTDGTERRLFTEAERNYCRSRLDPVLHFAGTLAVKEAVIKAGRLGSLIAWGRRIEVTRDPSGIPSVTLNGKPDHRFDISIAHDGPVAVAVAVVRRDHADAGSRAPEVAVLSIPKGGGLRPNEKVARYIYGYQQRSSAPTQLAEVSEATPGTDFP